jgi:hypothetical protein
MIELRYDFPGVRKRLRVALFKGFIGGFLIAAFIFIGLGYAWRMYQDRLIVQNYESARDRVANLEATLGMIIKESDAIRRNKR